MATALRKPLASTLSRAKDPCEVLFEGSSIEHIRDVHRRTQREIVDKQEELRQLVGGSYRELLGSADVIVEMRGVADSAVASLRAVRSGFATLAQAAEAAQPASRQAEAASAERVLANAMYAVGCRVKFLVDTPEVIWGCLDESQFAAAAERFLSALDLHAALTTDAAAAPHLAAFAVLRSQWPLVGSFRGVISKRARERLEEPGLQSSDIASVLSALATLEGGNTASALTMYLDAQRGAVQACLAGAAAEASGEGLSQALVRVVCLVQAAVCKAGELFLDAPGVAPLLPQALADIPAVEAQASGIPTPDKEVALWRERRAALSAQLAPLQAAQLASLLRAWLASLARTSPPPLHRCWRAAARCARARRGAPPGSRSWTPL